MVAVLGTAAVNSTDTTPRDQSADEDEDGRGRATGENSTPARASPSSSSPTPNVSTVAERLGVQTAVSGEHGVLDTAPAFVAALDTEGLIVLNQRRLRPPAPPRSPLAMGVSPKNRTMSQTQVAYILGALYTEAVRDGFQATAIVVTIVDRKGSPVVSYRIKREWATAFITGELSGEEFASQISGTACPGVCYTTD